MSVGAAIDRRPSRQEAVVRPLSFGDLRFVASLHERELPHGLFPALGRRLLRAYLSTFIASPHAVGLIAEVDGDRVGYLVGTIEHRAHVHFAFRRRASGLLGRASLAMLRRPHLFWRFVRTRVPRYVKGLMRAVRSAESADRRDPCHRDAILTHVAVAETARGKGVGAALVDAFVGNVSSYGVPGVRLVTRGDGTGASGFYERLGWIRFEEFTDRDGVTWIPYRLLIS